MRSDRSSEAISITGPPPEEEEGDEEGAPAGARTWRSASRYLRKSGVRFRVAMGGGRERIGESEIGGSERRDLDGEAPRRRERDLGQLVREERGGESVLSWDLGDTSPPKEGRRRAAGDRAQLGPDKCKTGKFCVGLGRVEIFASRDPVIPLFIIFFFANFEKAGKKICICQ